MRDLAHKFLGWVPTGAGSLLGLAVTLGGENVRLQVAKAGLAIWNDDAARTTFFCVAVVWAFLWIITKPTAWAWIKGFRRLPPTIYLRNIPLKSPYHPDKMFRIKWLEKDVSLTFRGEGSDGLTETPVQEPNITFDLLNAGDEPVRHVVARWRLLNVDLTEDVPLLGANVVSYENGVLKLKSDTCGSIKPVALEVESPPVPIVPSGSTISLQAPPAFTAAYCIRALARAKRQAMQGKNVSHDMLTLLERWGEAMDILRIELSYAKRGVICRHAFVVSGRVWGGTQPHIVSEESTEDNVIYQHADGIVAVVDHIGVSSGDRR